MTTPDCGPTPVAVLVDAYGTGRHLRSAFADLGARVVHVSSTREPMPRLRAPDLSGYDAALVGADPQQVVADLADLAPAVVVAGQEPGVPLADLLAERLGLPTNGCALSTARRDKYEMIDAVRRAGLQCAQQLRSDDEDEIVAWAGDRGYPIVIKPLAASGSQGLAICAGADDVRRALADIIGSTTMYDEANVAVLAQTYLAGTEYIVDTVSCRGQRYDAGIWRFAKQRQGTHNVPHRNILVAPDDPVADGLLDYVHEVLAALGIDFGAAHAEVMMTADGPALVEIGARLNGVMNPAFDAACCGADSATVSALAWLRPEEFLARYAGRRYRRRAHALVYHSTNELTGSVTAVDEDVLTRLRAVGSVGALTCKTDPGGILRPTVDLPSSPLTLLMSNVDEAELARDVERVDELCPLVFRTD